MELFIILQIRRPKIMWMTLLLIESILYTGKVLESVGKIYFQIPVLLLTRNMILIKFINLSKLLVSFPIKCKSMIVI